MADINNGRFWPVLYSIRFACIALYLFAVQIKNSKQFECYIFIMPPGNCQKHKKNKESLIH